MIKRISSNKKELGYHYSTTFFGPDIPFLRTFLRDTQMKHDARWSDALTEMLVEQLKEGESMVKRIRNMTKEYKIRPIYFTFLAEGNIPPVDWWGKNQSQFSIRDPTTPLIIDIEYDEKRKRTLLK